MAQPRRQTSRTFISQASSQLWLHQGSQADRTHRARCSRATPAAAGYSQPPLACLALAAPGQVSTTLGTVDGSNAAAAARREAKQNKLPAPGCAVPARTFPGLPAAQRQQRHTAAARGLQSADLMCSAPVQRSSSTRRAESQRRSVVHNAAANAAAASLAQPCSIDSTAQRNSGKRK